MTAAPHAWVDESMRVTAGGGHYLLAAAIADPTAEEPVRDVLRSLLVGRASRLHWHDQTPRRRRRIAEAIAELELVHIVIVGAPITPRRQERARRQCLERLLFEVASLGVDQVWIESRTSSLNSRDLTLIAALRSRRAVPEHLAVGFAQPDQEPMLWLPDAVAGMIGGLLHDGTAPSPALRARIQEHWIALS